jgi:hypothetical protein
MRIPILMTLTILTSLFVDVVQTGCCQQRKETNGAPSCKYQDYHKDEECTNNLEHFLASKCIENKTTCDLPENYNFGDLSFLDELQPKIDGQILI